MRDPKKRYYLEAKDKDVLKRTEPELVMVEVNYGYSEYAVGGGKRNKPFRFSLEGNMLPKHFGLIKDNFKFNKAVFNKNQKSSATIKTKMFQLENALNELANNYQINRIFPKPEEFKNDLKIKLGLLNNYSISI
tara:strand:- start:139 stop:540 length:402 start_codon:yes stop_codon:yes gene_type:complete